jgi:hypothetical protein
MRVIVNMNGRRANPDNATPTYSTEEDEPSNYGGFTQRNIGVYHQNRYHEDSLMNINEGVVEKGKQDRDFKVIIKKGGMRTSRYKTQKLANLFKIED